MRNVAIVKNIVGNYSLQHNFRFRIPNLPGAAGFVLEFLAMGASTPDKEIIPVEVWWRGRKGEMAGSVRTDGDMAITFNIDATWLGYDQLFKASEMVVDNKLGLSRDWRLYSFKTYIQVLNPSLGDTVMRTFTLLDCYVKQIGKVEKSHQSQADKDEVELTIHYDDFAYTIL